MNILFNFRFQADNPKVAGPRLCALRIQNGTSNILLDNIESSELSPVVYTRRTRFLDEELDETKDIITSTGSSQSIDFTAIIPPTVITNIGSGNKTDYEKSVGSKPHGNSTVGSIESAADGSGIAQPPPSHPAPVLQQQLLPVSTSVSAPPHNCEKLEIDDHTTMSSRNANKSCTQSSSISSEPDIQESTLLRRQQLTRVAEWVQNNHLDNIVGPISSQSASSSVVDAESIDSGYKTKINNNNRMPVASNDLIMLATSNQPIPSMNNRRHHPPISNRHIIVSTSSLSDDNKLATDTNHEFAQNNINNNLMVDKRLLDAMSNGNSRILVDDVPATAQIDFAQMEYNVKQFLLKQNEWSIHSNSKGDADSCTLLAPNTTPTDDSSITVTTTKAKVNVASVQTIAKRPHRTETNL